MALFRLSWSAFVHCFNSNHAVALVVAVVVTVVAVVEVGV